MTSWKKSVRKVPAEILSAIDHLPGETYLVYGVRRMSKTDLQAGELSDLGVSCSDAGVVACHESVLLGASLGPWARRNQTGWERVRKDLPKVTKTYSVEVPNFGDWDKGSHSISWTREVYQREVLPPAGFTLRVAFLNDTANDVDVLVEVDFEFNRHEHGGLLLLLAVNLVQLAIGRVAVRTPEVAPTPALRVMTVDWELLPVGHLVETIPQIAERLGVHSVPEQTILHDRLTFLESQGPSHLIAGASGFARYVGALFNENLVAFENIRYGNALYVMFDDWATSSQMSRIDLLSSDRNFVRIIHHAHWKERAARVIAEHK